MTKCRAYFATDCNPEFRFKKRSNDAKFGRCLHMLYVDPLSRLARLKMDHFPIRQTFKFEKNFSTVGKSLLNLVKLSSLVVKCRKYSNVKFVNFVYFCITQGKCVTTFPHSGNTLPGVVQISCAVQIFLASLVIPGENLFMKS